MFTCPRCTLKLRRLPVEKGIAWCCPSCRGRTATIALLRKAVPPDVVQSLWKDALYGRRGHGVRCPSCLLPMSEVDLAAAEGAPVLDVCRRCHFVWFDAGEYETLPRQVGAPAPTPQPARRLPTTGPPPLPFTRRRRWSSASSDTGGRVMPSETWKWLPGLFGMPVEFDTVPIARPAYATYALLVLVTSVSLLAFTELRAVIDGYGFVPADPFRKGGVTFFTSFLLHAGWLHLAGNMYFLWVFGDNVEDRLGPPRYLFLLLGATLVGHLSHWIVTDDPNVPCVGASGGISGVIAYYALAYPRVRLGLLFFYFWWIRLSALVAFFLWIGLQILGASLLEDNVAYGAHLGGALLGVVYWWVGKLAENR